MPTTAMGGPLRSLALLGAALAVWAVPGEVQACGGLFCSRTPVDQSGERILFTVNDDDTVTAHVQITYAGERDDFAWIVPVATVPKLGTFPQLAINALDLATAPDFRFDPCFNPIGASLIGPGVLVHARQSVGPYDTVVIEGRSAQALIDWLNDNGYQVTSGMEPYIQVYVDEGMKFLAMKLSPDAGVADIAPLSMTYEGDTPAIPIRLTAVAAEPDMNITVWILGDTRYGPGNFDDLRLGPDQVVRSGGWWRRTTNYRALVSREVDRLGGQAFVTEYAAEVDDLIEQINSSPVASMDGGAKAQKKLLETLGRHRYITRLHTRMSAGEMTVDPWFVPVAEEDGVSNIHELKDDDCKDPPRCTSTYCGREGVCVPTLSYGEACYCSERAVGRVTGDWRQTLPTPVCEALSSNMMPIEAFEKGWRTGPCAGVTCGRGRCVAFNGTPSCQCDTDAAVAVDENDDGIVPRCVLLIGKVPPLPDHPPPPPLPHDPPLLPTDPVHGGVHETVHDVDAGAPSQLRVEHRKLSLCSAGDGNPRVPVGATAAVLCWLWLRRLSRTDRPTRAARSG